MVEYQEACSFCCQDIILAENLLFQRRLVVFSGELKAVCSFGKPASASLCKGIMRGEYQGNVYELNRLCRVEDLVEPLSQFVCACLRRLSGENWIIVSYADTGMNHSGYIYQACNFIYF